MQRVHNRIVEPKTSSLKSIIITLRAFLHSSYPSIAHAQGARHFILGTSFWLKRDFENIQMRNANQTFSYKIPSKNLWIRVLPFSNYQKFHISKQLKAWMGWPTHMWSVCPFWYMCKYLGNKPLSWEITYSPSFFPVGYNNKGKGIWFIVLYPPKCSLDLLSLAGHFNPLRDIPEQLAAYSAQALSTVLLMLGTHFAPE